MNKRDQVQEEALVELRKYKRGSLNISQRLGKTRIVCMRLDELLTANKALRALICIPKLSIIQSWKDECIKLNKVYLLEHITFTTYLSLDKQGQYYDVLVGDEIHHLKTNKSFWLDWFPGDIIGLTGTLPKRGEKAKMIAKYCPVVYTYLTTEAVEDQVLNDYQILVHKIPIGEAKTVKQVNSKTGGVYYQSEKEIYNYWTNRVINSKSPKDRQLTSVMRMKAMQTFNSKLVYARRLLDSLDEKCIVFTNTIEQAENICKYSYNSKNEDSKDNLEMFRDGYIDKLSCIQQISEGITVNGLKAGIALHQFSGDSSKGLQRFTRLLSLEPGDFATYHILCYTNTVDEKWVSESLAELDPSKIKYVEFQL